MSKHDHRRSLWIICGDPVRDYLREQGRKGGKARAEKLSPERRQEIARQGGKAPRRKRDTSR